MSLWDRTRVVSKMGCSRLNDADEGALLQDKLDTSVCPLRTSTA
jgi:hypothetical protein